MENMAFDYFYDNENEQYLFIQLPIMLIKDEKFRHLSSDTIILYSLMLDRTALSKKNGWRDEDGRTYIIYTIENIMDDLNCWKEKANKSLKELKEIGLIKTVRRGLGKPNIIYVMNFATKYKYTKKDKKEPESPDIPQNTDNRTSSFSGIELQGFRESNSNHINRNQTNFQSDVSIYQGEPKKETPVEEPAPTNNHDKIDTTDNIIKVFTPEEVADKISLDELKNTYADKHDEVNMLYDIVCEVLTVDNPPTPTFRISKQNIPFINVKTAFLSLEKQHIEYVIDCLNKNDNKFKIKGNTKSYLMTALFNSIRTISYYFNRSFKKPPKEKDKWEILWERQWAEQQAKHDLEKCDFFPDNDFDFADGNLFC